MTTIVDGTTGITFPSAISGVSATQQYSGRILQVVCNNYTTYTSGTNATYGDVSGFSVSITPTSSSNKILIMYNINGITTAIGSSTGYAAFFQLTDSSNTQLIQLLNCKIVGGDQSYGEMGISGCYLHSPSTTSALTYKIRAKDDGSSHGWQVNNYASTPTTYSSLLAMEIAA